MPGASLLALWLALAPPVEAEPQPGAPWAEVVERYLLEAEVSTEPSARDLLLAAVEAAGPEALPVLVRRLESRLDDSEGALSAWALGELLRPEPGLPAPRQMDGRDDAVASLLIALHAGSPDVRLAAVSALGAMEAPEAEPALFELLEEGLPPTAEDVVLLALAGLRQHGLPFLLQRLDRGGDERWSEAVVRSFVRWGGSAWPELCERAETSADPRVRAAALTSLLLLAEPASACALGEMFGREPEPVLRRLILQALAASAHPLARDQLRLVAREESDERLREAARILEDSLRLAEDRRRRASRGGATRSVTELLGELERRPGLDWRLRDIEERASASHVPVLDRTLRRLPLRGDERALRDHARLAQLRSRLLCLDGIDCRR